MSIDYCYDRDGKRMSWDWWREESTARRKWSTEQRVARTVVGDWTVSTVWLHGIDHNHGDGPPIIFETMVFGPTFNQELQRYSTEEAAMRGHLDALSRLRTGRPPFSYLDEEDE